MHDAELKEIVWQTNVTSNAHNTFLSLGTKGFNGVIRTDVSLLHCGRIFYTKIQQQNQCKCIKVKLLTSREIDFRFHLMMDVVMDVRHFV